MHGPHVSTLEARLRRGAAAGSRRLGTARSAHVESPLSEQKVRETKPARGSRQGGIDGGSGRSVGSHNKDTRRWFKLTVGSVHR